MNQQFHRSLPIQRVMCVKRCKTSTGSQSFPDPFCLFFTAEGDLHGEGEGCGSVMELDLGVGIPHPLLQLCESQGTGWWWDTAHSQVCSWEGDSCQQTQCLGKGKGRAWSVAPLSYCRYRTAPGYLGGVEQACHTRQLLLAADGFMEVRKNDAESCGNMILVFDTCIGLMCPWVWDLSNPFPSCSPTLWSCCLLVGFSVLPCIWREIGPAVKASASVEHRAHSWVRQSWEKVESAQIQRASALSKWRLYIAVPRLGTANSPMQRHPLRLAADSSILPFILPLLIFFSVTVTKALQKALCNSMVLWMTAAKGSVPYPAETPKTPANLGGRGWGVFLMFAKGYAWRVQDQWAVQRPHLCLGCVFQDLLASRAPREMQHHFHSCLNVSPEAASALE